MLGYQGMYKLIFPLNVCVFGKLLRIFLKGRWGISVKSLSMWFTPVKFSGYWLGLEHDNKNSILGTESVSKLLLHFASTDSDYTIFWCQFSIVMITVILLDLFLK